MKFPKIHNPCFVALVATIGGVRSSNYMLHECSSVSTYQVCPPSSVQISTDYFDNPAGIRQGAIGSSLAAGSVVGSAFAGSFSDWIGRRNSIFYSCFFWIAGTALQTAINGFGMLVAGRILNGITVGVTSMFIVFGTMCFLGAAQFFLTYPETSGKSLEEIELLFSGKIKPWHTKPGQSKLDDMVNEVRDKHFTISEAKHKFGHHEHVEVVGDERA